MISFPVSCLNMLSSPENNHDNSCSWRIVYHFLQLVIECLKTFNFILYTMSKDLKKITSIYTERLYK